MSCSGRTSLLRSAVVAVALLLAGLTAAPAAQASSEQTFPVGSAEFQRARDIAQAHWGAVPCQGQVTFSWQGLEPLTNARASWSNPTHAWNNPRANFDCAVVFNALTQYDFPMLCTVMAHELGHLLGHAHDAQDGMLMSAIYSTPLPACGDSSQPAAAAADSARADDDRSGQKRKRGKKARSAKKSAKRKRCIVRLKAGERIRRCMTLKKRSSRKARTAGYQRQTRRYAAH